MESLKLPYSFHGFAHKLFGWKCPVPNSLVIDCHNNIISSNLCEDIVNHHNQHQTSLVLCCSGEQKTNMESLVSLQNLKHVNTVVYQGWYENDGDYWTHRKRLPFFINVIPKNTQHLYIEYSYLSVDVLKEIAIKFPNLKTLAFQKISLTSISNDFTDVETLRNWKLDTLKLQDVFFSVPFLQAMPKTLKRLILKDTLLRQVGDQDKSVISLSDTFPHLESFSIGILNESIDVYSDFLKHIPKTLTELTFYGGCSEELNDEYVITLLCNNPNIDKIGIFTYYILTDKFSDWATNEWNSSRNKHIIVNNQYVENTYTYKLTKIPMSMMTVVTE